MQLYKFVKMRCLSAYISLQDISLTNDIFVNENKIKTKFFRFLLTKTKTITKIIFKTKTK